MEKERESNELAGVYVAYWALLDGIRTVPSCGIGPGLLAADGDSPLAQAGLLEQKELSSVPTAVVKFQMVPVCSTMTTV